MARVISDAGPLIASGKAGLLSIPRRLFTRISIPDAVWRECQGRAGEDTLRIEEAVREGWLEALPPGAGRIERLPSRLARHLGDGETAALAYALASERALLIVDDRIARRAAEQLGVNYVGTARLLWLAERRAMIDSAADAIANMAACGYRISPKILDDLPRPDG